MNIIIKKYQPESSIRWNAFIKHSINGTFLLDRDFMDYHKDRFNDASLMIYNDHDLLACMPANLVNDHFYSHQGLTYGGIFLKEELHIKLLHTLVSKLIHYLKSNYKSFQVKWQAQIYNDNNLKLLELFKEHHIDTFQSLHNLHVDLNEQLQVSTKKTVGYRNGKFNEMRLVINDDFKIFWSHILEPQLLARHQTTPVHSIKEIELLAGNFPEKIKQYLVYEKDELLAGVTFFLKNKIAKSQYAAATIKGMKKSALDFLYIEATQDFKDSGYRYIDYGHVNEKDGSVNRGLQRFKEELGAVNQPVFTSQWNTL